MTKYNLLIVEDHALTRFALKTAFETADFVNQVYEAEDAQTAYKIEAQNKIDAVLMDLGLPNINGIEACKTLKTKKTGLKILILTSHEQEEEVIDSIKAGANAYCSKDIEPEKLKEIVLSVLNGAAWFDPKVADFVLKTVANTEKEKLVSNEELNLTEREKQVLALIAEGLNNTEIAKKLDVSINTTKAHVCNILQKLSVQDRTQAAIKAIKYRIILQNKAC